MNASYLSRPETAFNQLVMELNMGRVPNWLQELGYDMRITNSDRDTGNFEWFWMSVVAKALKLSNFVPIFPSMVQIHGWGVMSVLNVKSFFSEVVVYIRQNVELTARSQLPDVFYLSPAFQRLLALWLKNNHPIMAKQVDIYMHWLTDEHKYVIDMYL